MNYNLLINIIFSVLGIILPMFLFCISTVNYVKNKNKKVFIKVILVLIIFIFYYIFKIGGLFMIKHNS